MYTVTVEEAGAQISRLIAAVSQGEEIIITHDRKPVARLARVLPDDTGGPADTAHAALFRLWKGKITLDEGWDEPLAEMEAYTR